MKNIISILANALPVLLMVWLIPQVSNDYVLALIYLGIASSSLAIKRYAKEISIFICGMVCMTFFEWIFVLTGVEQFSRRTLFGLMPIWLPVLWGYGFIAIKRAAHTIEDWG